jgi:uncharacterized membrane protein
MKKYLFISAVALTMMAAMPYTAQAQTARVDWKAAHQHRDDVLAQLPADKANAYKDTMRAVFKKNQPIHEQIEKLRADIKAVMSAPTFDKGAYVSKNADMEKLYGQMRGNIAEAVAGLVASWSSDERKTLAKLHDGAANGDQPQPAK